MMTGQILIGVGVAVNIIGIVLLYKDCYYVYGATMGGEMLAGFLWVMGSVLLSAGIFFTMGNSIFLGALSLVLLVIIFLPCRWAVIRLGSKHGKTLHNHRSFGFAEHVRREEDLHNKK